MRPSLPPTLLLVALVATCHLVPGEATGADAGAKTGTTPVRIGPREWAPTTSGEDVPWAQADRYCRNLALAGHDDWRLPTLAELEALLVPDAQDGVPRSFAIDSCCAWSSTSLAERAAERGGPGAGAPSQYYWGLLLDGGTRYYSFGRIPDGRALCVRDAD